MGAVVCLKKGPKKGREKDLFVLVMVMVNLRLTFPFRKPNYPGKSKRTNITDWMC